MDEIWKLLDKLDVRALTAAAFNAGVLYWILRGVFKDVKKLKRRMAWTVAIVSKLKMLHESKYEHEDLGKDWEEGEE